MTTVNRHHRKIGRAWIYLRGGYSIYFSFLFGVANSLILVYYVVLQSADCTTHKEAFLCTIKPLFPNFGIFIIIALGIGIPLMIWLGRFHYKKQLYKSEIEVVWGNNPFYFKLIGHQKILFEVCLQLLNELKERDKSDPKRVEKLTELEDKINLLLDGGSVD